MKKLLFFIFTVYFALCTMHCSAQWVQTNGPNSNARIKVSGIFQKDSIIVIATNCGLFEKSKINNSWQLKYNINDELFYPILPLVYTQKGDSLFYGGDYGINLIDLSNSNYNPINYGLDGINILIHSDTCLYAGTNEEGFCKSLGFSDNWDFYNTGLPLDSEIVWPGIEEYIHPVYSIDKNTSYFFAGTEYGIFRANPNDFKWQSINSGVPLEKVSLIKVIQDTIFMGIGNDIYYSLNNGDTWKSFFSAPTQITSIFKTGKVFFITTKGSGIYSSINNGSSWEQMNAGLADLDVNVIQKIDNTLICGSDSLGFYYYNNNLWVQNNFGINCSEADEINYTNKLIVANDNLHIYVSKDAITWLSIKVPDIIVDSNLSFGISSILLKEDTIFISYFYGMSNWPFNFETIKYTNDLGNSWLDLNGYPPFTDDGAYEIYGYGNRIYAFIDDKMYYTDNLGTSWTDISLPTQYCNQFSGFFVYNSICYASTCGNSEFITLDKNNNWILTNNNGLPSNQEIWGISNCDSVFFAYEDNMYVSFNNGNNWTYANNGLSNGLRVRSYCFL